jgi:hypothetical protein
MNGECFEHNIQWFSGGIECPLCKLEDAACDVYSWIENWSPEFTDDDEWEKTEQKWKAAIAYLKSEAE